MCRSVARRLPVLVLCSVALACGPDRRSGSLETTLDARVPGLLEETSVPGAAVAVIRGGKVAFLRGYGYADAEHRTPVTETTGFNVGSISKTPTAWAVMRLVGEGKVDLDAPVSRYLTRWHLPPSEFDADGVTPRRLLSHTAGLSLHGYPGFGPDDLLPSIEESLAGETNGSGAVELILEPGTKWQYSGGGYTIAQLLIEEVTGESYQDYMRKAVLRPLGMEHSDYELTPDILAGSALCYDGLGAPTPSPRFAARAAAGLHTTIADLARFALAAMPGPAGEPAGRGVLAPQSIESMLARADAADLGEGKGYGLGYFLHPLTDERRTVGHGGANRGWHALFEVIPETGDGIVVMTNGSNGWAVHQQVRCAWVESLTGTRPGGDECKRPVSFAVLHALQAGGLAAARETYFRERAATDSAYSFDEGQLNNLGYELLGAGRTDDAVGVFELNVEAYPESWNPYDSLGEAYRVTGRRDRAIESYEKSVALNPENEAGEKALAELKAE